MPVGQIVAMPVGQIVPMHAGQIVVLPIEQLWMCPQDKCGRACRTVWVCLHGSCVLCPQSRLWIAQGVGQGDAFENADVLMVWQRLSLAI